MQQLKHTLEGTTGESGEDNSGGRGRGASNEWNLPPQHESRMAVTGMEAVVFVGEYGNNIIQNNTIVLGASVVSVALNEKGKRNFDEWRRSVFHPITAASPIVHTSDVMVCVGHLTSKRHFEKK